MKALITGASSGLGREMAKVLSNKGYDIIAVARREDLLLSLKDELKTEVTILVADVTKKEELEKISAYAEECDILINNAGFGVFGEFLKTDTASEMKMIETNIMALHILTKNFLKVFKEKGEGHILNVASLAAFFPGPLFSSYYATKSYVLRLSQSIAEELRQDKSKVKISVLCPGPVHTEFEKTAKVSFGKGTEKMGKSVILESPYVAEYAIAQMLSGKEIIVPGALMKIGVFMRHLCSDKLLAKILYFIQSKKMTDKN